MLFSINTLPTVSVDKQYFPLTALWRRTLFHRNHITMLPVSKSQAMSLQTTTHITNETNCQSVVKQRADFLLRATESDLRPLNIGPSHAWKKTASQEY